MKPPAMLQHPLGAAHLRIARPTDHLDEVVAFYEALGFKRVGGFVDHDGIDGVMLGHDGAGSHLEFTHHRGHTVGGAPTADHLLVFYVPDAATWSAVTASIEARGLVPVPSANPYWDRHGRTYEDPDGYRVVIQHSAWPPG